MELLPAVEKPIQHVLSWNPPPAPYLKFNVDGAIFSNLQFVGIGVIVRKWDGSFVTAMSKLINAPLGPLEAEFKAIDVGLQLAKVLGVSELIIEGDSLIVSRALSQSSSVLATNDAMIMGIRSAVVEFHNVNFSHVKRNANIPAHLRVYGAQEIMEGLVG
ncbi:hypothetical protein CFP56_016805 [Quercus suber]|uniref:RNase H type-1 domain-containing protein n=1 Tax=Quercus suber TaxID=58331 RepID=A0AAW0KPJ5_QUESU